MALTLNGSDPTGDLGDLLDAKLNIAGGKVLQVVQGASTTETATTSATLIDTTLSATITPSATTSKILVIVSQNIFASGTGDCVVSFAILRGVTNAREFGRAFGVATTGVTVSATISLQHLDSPASTSALTYKTQFRRVAGSNGITAQVQSSPSIITLMEISE